MQQKTLFRKESQKNWTHSVAILGGTTTVKKQASLSKPAFKNLKSSFTTDNFIACEREMARSKFLYKKEEEKIMANVLRVYKSEHQYFRGLAKINILNKNKINKVRKKMKKNAYKKYLIISHLLHVMKI